MVNSKNHQIVSGGQAVVEIFKSKGSNNVFGLIGSSTMELFDALYDNNEINFIDVRDERTGTHMADGYARASGNAGIMIAGQNGPGATNLVSGVAQANAAFSPLISIAGAVTSEHKGKDTFQEIDQQSLFEPITKKTFSINQESKIPEILNEAYSIALQPRCGPVHINIPRDIFANKFDESKSSRQKAPRRSPKHPVPMVYVEKLSCSWLKCIFLHFLQNLEVHDIVWMDPFKCCEVHRT